MELSWSVAWVFTSGGLLSAVYLCAECRPRFQTSISDKWEIQKTEDLVYCCLLIVGLPYMGVGPAQFATPSTIFSGIGGFLQFGISTEILEGEGVWDFMQVADTILCAKMYQTLVERFWLLIFPFSQLLEMSSKTVSTISELKIACDEAHNKKYKKGRFLGKVSWDMSHSQTMLQRIN